MNRLISRCSLLCCILLSCTAFAQTKFDAHEFANRRAKLFEQTSDGVAIIFGEEEGPAPVKFRQAPDFYYLTGIEDPGAILMMVGPTNKAIVFAYPRSAQKIKFQGLGLLEMEKAKEIYGLDQISPMEDLPAALLFNGLAAKHLYLPVTLEDTLQKARTEMLLAEQRLMNHPLYRSSNIIRAANLHIRDLLPTVPIVDLGPMLNKMRAVKSPYEIERMRRAGKIGAAAVKEAIKGTKPGMYEYEIEAAARFVTTKAGAGIAYTPIVASGENTIYAHYEENNRQMQAGDIVLMDFGADYDYYVSDITRTWPVSGRFTPEQEKMYRCVLDSSKALIAAMKPGVTIAQMKDIAGEIYKKYGYEQQYNDWGRYVGHYVGISVHDVNPGFDVPLQAGATFNVEPILEFRDKKVHFRLEDSVLITPTGAENLTADVPVELEDIYALIKQKGLN